MAEMVLATRRTVLKGAAVGAGLAGIPAYAAITTAAAQSAIIYDRRIAESLAFARDYARGSVPESKRSATTHPTRSLPEPRAMIDLANEARDGWPMLRGNLPDVTTLDGLCGWSDWVVIRSELAALGWRRASEQVVRAPISGKTHLLRWQLVLPQRAG